MHLRLRVTDGAPWRARVGWRSSLPSKDGGSKGEVAEDMSQRDEPSGTTLQKKNHGPRTTGVLPSILSKSPVASLKIQKRLSQDLGEVTFTSPNRTIPLTVPRGPRPATRVTRWTGHVHRSTGLLELNRHPGRITW